MDNSKRQGGTLFSKPSGGRQLAKNGHSPRTDNLLESLRDIGSSTKKALKRDVVQGVPREFMKQLFGTDRVSPRRVVPGEIKPGQTVDIERISDKEYEEKERFRLKLTQERRLRSEDKALFERRSQELKVELKALVDEVGQLAKTTEGLSRSTKIASLQAPANPGVYHVTFFDKLREFIRSFRKKIESASLWLQSSNQRAAKKRGFWGQVQQSGTRRLLSPEDYSQRSAG